MAGETPARPATVRIVSPSGATVGQLLLRRVQQPLDGLRLAGVEPAPRQGGHLTGHVSNLERVLVPGQGWSQRSLAGLPLSESSQHFLKLSTVWVTTQRNLPPSKPCCSSMDNAPSTGAAPATRTDTGTGWSP